MPVSVPVKLILAPGIEARSDLLLCRSDLKWSAKTLWAKATKGTLRRSKRDRFPCLKNKFQPHLQDPRSGCGRCCCYGGYLSESAGSLSCVGVSELRVV